MHEFSVILSIIEIADEAARENHANTIESIEMDIGILSGIEYDAFDFAWDAAVQDTILENAERRVNKIPGKAKCSNCAIAFDVESYYEPCPVCGEILNEIIGGRELKVKQLVMFSN